LNSTVTAGIISAKGRSIDIMSRQGKGFAPIESFIQTDAAVNPGNSGGALVNTKGELIGINTAIKSPTGTFTGYSFAVPVNIVKKVVEDLRDFGVVQRGFLGVTIRNVDSELANELNLDQPSGVYVNGLMDEGAAADAGIKEGDVIIAVGGESIRNVPELQEQVGRYRPGDEVTISVLREGEMKQIPLVLRNKFGTTKVIEKESADKWVVLGAECIYPEKDLLEELNLENGVQVKKLNDGKLKAAGLKEGFIIVRVDKMPVESPEQLAKLFSGQTGGMLIEGVYPNGKRGYYGVGM
jgi:S1-C subfamily serine protease